MLAKGLEESRVCERSRDSRQDANATLTVRFRGGILRRSRIRIVAELSMWALSDRSTRAISIAAFFRNVQADFAEVANQRSRPSIHVVLAHQFSHVLHA